MSDAPGGPDWEHGSDGKWYGPGVLSGAGWTQASDGLYYRPQPAYAPIPPQGAPGAPQGAPGAPRKKGMSGCLLAFLIVLGISVVGGVLVVVVVAAGTKEAVDTANEDNATSGGGEPNPGELFPDRADTQEEDQEREIGQSAGLSGYTATVESAEFVQEVDTFQTAGYVKIHVVVENRDSSAQPVSMFDWSLQSPTGTVDTPTLTVAEGEFQDSDLVGGGTTEGDVYFEVGDEQGDFFIIYKPDAFDAARGIWQVSVP